MGSAESARFMWVSTFDPVGELLTCYRRGPDGGHSLRTDDRHLLISAIHSGDVSRRSALLTPMSLGGPLGSSAGRSPAHLTRMSPRIVDVHSRVHRVAPFPTSHQVPLVTASIAPHLSSLRAAPAIEGMTAKGLKLQPLMTCDEPSRDLRRSHAHDMSCPFRVAPGACSGGHSSAY